VSLGYGNPRFNVTAQPSLAIGLVAGALTWRAGSRARSEQGDATDPV
jgi:hypothetical protein